MLKRSKHLHEKLRKKVMADKKMKAIHEAYSVQLDLASTLQKARAKMKLSKEEVAARMNTTKSVVTRIESGGHDTYSPSLATLCRYANALGCTLKITLVPKNRRQLR